jgi:tetratricopeptide (TPR) repeat protein
MTKMTATIKYGLIAAACALVCAALVWRDQLVDPEFRSSGATLQEVEMMRRRPQEAETWRRPPVGENDWETKLATTMMEDFAVDRAQGMASLRDIVDNCPPSRVRIRAMLYLGNRLIQDRSYDEALGLLNEALEATGPEGLFADSELHGQILAHLARGEFYAGRPADSIIHARQAFECGGLREWEFHKLSVMNFTVLGMWDEAYDHVKYLEDSPEALDQTMVSMVHEAQGRPHLAELARSRAEAINRKEAAAWRERLETGRPLH